MRIMLPAEAELPEILQVVTQAAVLREADHPAVAEMQATMVEIHPTMAEIQVTMVEIHPIMVEMQVIRLEQPSL